MPTITIPAEHAATVLHALCMGADRAECTLHCATQSASLALANWAEGDARDPIPEYLSSAIRSGHIRPDTAWAQGPSDWLVALLDAAEEH